MSAAPARAKVRPERLRELSLLAVIAVSVLVFSQLVDNYLSGSFFNRVTTSMAITAVLAAAQTLVILTRNIDLSVGSIVGVTAYLTGEYLAGHQATAPLLAVGLAMLIGGALGLLNGTLVAYGRVPSIIVTLGTLAIYRTWLIDHARARTITADSLPRWLVEFPQGSVLRLGGLDIRVVLAVAVLVIVALQVALGRLRWGRWVYAVGSNPDAARQEGLPVERITLGRSSCAAPCRGWRASCSCPASGPSRWPRARGWSWPRSPPRWSAGSASSAAPAPCSGRCWARC
jgi:rhamnose transport system permease protein